MTFVPRTVPVVLALALGFATPARASGPPIQQRVLPDGLAVIVVEDHSQPLVTIEIAFKNGSMTEPPEYNGLSHLYEHMFFKANQALPDQEAWLARARALGMIWNGTTNTERVNYFFSTTTDHFADTMTFMRRKLADLGATIAGTTERDWSVIEGKSPAAGFEDTFGLVAEAFLAPAMPESEVTLARNQEVLALKRLRENPDGALELLVEATVFKGHPYANRPGGTPDTVAKLGREQLAAHLDRLRETSRLVLVVVGAVEPQRVVALARQAYGALPRGSWSPAALSRPSFSSPALTTETRKLPTNYLQAMFTAPGPGAPDYAAARVANFALGQRLFEEVRTKRNLSYAPGARYEVAADSAMGGIYVTAVDPNATLPVMLGELTRLREQPIPTDELAGYESLYRTRFLMAQETTDGQATSLARGLLLAGDWRYFDRLLGLAAKVTAADVQAYARTYARNLQFVMLGDPAKLDPKLTAY